MSIDEHYRKLERMYHQHAPINQFFRPALRVSEGAAEVVTPVGEHLLHAARAAHGAVYFKALDDAAFFAVASLVTDVFVVTSQFSLNFLRPVTGGSMRAVGRVVHASRNLWIAEAEAFDDRGKPVARGSGSFMKSPLRLADVAGYA